MSTQIHDILIKNNVITPEQLREARAKSRENGGSVSGALIELGYLEEHSYVELLARHYGVKKVNLEGI